MRKQIIIFFSLSLAFLVSTWPITNGKMKAERMKKPKKKIHEIVCEMVLIVNFIYIFS